MGTILLGMFPAALTGTAVMAAERYPQKKEAEAIAAMVKAALPPAPGGWKIVSTRTTATPPTRLPGQTIRKGYAPLAARQYASVTGDRTFSLTIVFGIKPDLDSQDARYRTAVPRWPTAEIRKINGQPVYFLPTASSLNYYSRVASFAIFGKSNDRGIDKRVILALLGQVDVATLKALRTRLRK